MRNRLVFSLGLGLVLVTGCETEKISHGKAKVIAARAQTLAEAYCAAYEACDCAPIATDAVHPDPSQCVANEKARLIGAFEQAEGDGLSFDQSCMDDLVSRYGALGCASVSSIYAEMGNPLAVENFGCALYHGDQNGGACEPVAGTSWSDCSAGLRCLDSACAPELSLGGEGAMCGFTGVSRAFTTSCLPGLYCDQFDGCKLAQGLGDPCLRGGDGSLTCAADLYCDPLEDDSIEGTCEPLLAGGEVCEPYECHGWCELDSEQSLGECLDVPAVCLDLALQPPV